MDTPFNLTPTVVAEGAANSAAFQGAAVAGVSTTGFTANIRLQAGIGAGSVTVHWIAMERGTHYVPLG